MQKLQHATTEYTIEKKKKLYRLLLSRSPITNAKLKTNKNPHSLLQKQVDSCRFIFILYTFFIIQLVKIPSTCWCFINCIPFPVLILYCLLYMSAIITVSYVPRILLELMLFAFLISAQKSGEQRSLSVQFHLISGGNATDSSWGLSCRGLI